MRMCQRTKRNKVISIICGKLRIGNDKDIDSCDEELTGIAGLKAMKRKKEIDDLWASMQEDDGYYKKKAPLPPQPLAKAIKTHEGQRVAAATIQVKVVEQDTKAVEE